MTINEIYELAITMGIESDPRGKDGVKKILKRMRDDYKELSQSKKDEFDEESFKNPYADSRILFGDPSTIVDTALVGIDISPAEVLLADRLNQKGEGIDLIIGHHPHGMALAGLYDVLELQVDMLAQYGVPVNVVEGLMRERIEEVRRIFAPRNHFQSVDAARLLGLPFMNVHTPTDNLVHQFLEKEIKRCKPERVGDVLKMLKNIPEYKEATKLKSGPILFAGSEKNRAGRVIASEITGGVEGAKEIYEKLVQAGIGTVIAMHASEEHRSEAQKHHLNLVIAGHIVSDSLGMNLFLDAMEKKSVKVIPCSGLIRIRRN